MCVYGGVCIIISGPARVSFLTRVCCTACMGQVGYTCAGGIAQPSACAVAGHWCPLGSFSASAASCARGYYGTSAGAAGYTTPSCAGACSCNPGYASTATGQSACGTTVAPCNQCAQGSYCLGGGAQPATCLIGSVPAGSYCPAGTTTLSGTTCPTGSSCAGAAANASTSLACMAAAAAVAAVIAVTVAVCCCSNVVRDYEDECVVD